MKPTHFVGPAANLVPSALPKIPFEIPARVAERAATRYVEDESGCFISTYSTASHGYAQVGWQSKTEPRRMTLAHRAAWVYANGTQIPEGMTIDHLCKNRRCVNPNHLRLLTNFENARRTSGRDWPIGVCANGHPNSALEQEPSGRWRCSACYPRGEAKAPKMKKPKPPAKAKAPRPAPKPRASATHCKRGHEFTDENTYSPPRGERWCRACMQERDRSRVKRKRIGSKKTGGWRWETAEEARARTSTTGKASQ